MGSSPDVDGLENRQNEVRSAQAFDDEGTRLYGGLWNSPGVKIAYTSENLALAALEIPDAPW